MQCSGSFDLKIEWQVSYSISFSRKKLQKLLFVIAKFQKLKGEYGVSVHLIDEIKMRSLNQKFRQTDQVTDVISFPTGFSKLSPKTPNLLGDIFVCVPQLMKQAKEQKVSESLELEILIVHGFLHLLGFDHEKDHELWNKTLQTLYQNKILSYNHIRYAKEQAS